MEEELQKEKSNVLFWGIIKIIIIALVISGTFILGAYYSCEHNNTGKLNGLKCIEPKVIGACKDGEQLFLNTSELLQNGRS